jgi:hypothetical protein
MLLFLQKRQDRGETEKEETSITASIPFDYCVQRHDGRIVSLPTIIVEFVVYLVVDNITKAFVIRQK